MDIKRKLLERQEKISLRISSLHEEKQVLLAQIKSIQLEMDENMIRLDELEKCIEETEVKIS